MEVLQLLAAGPDEHVAHEESMVGTSADNTDVDAVALVPAGETIDNVDTVAGVEVVNSTLAVDTPDLKFDCQYICSAHRDACESEQCKPSRRCRERPKLIACRFAGCGGLRLGNGQREHVTYAACPASTHARSGIGPASAVVLHTIVTTCAKCVTGYYVATHIRRHGLVDRAPPNVVLGAVLLYDTLVGR